MSSCFILAVVSSFIVIWSRDLTHHVPLHGVGGVDLPSRLLVVLVSLAELAVGISLVVVEVLVELLVLAKLIRDPKLEVLAPLCSRFKTAPVRATASAHLGAPPPSPSLHPRIPA